MAQWVNCADEEPPRNVYVIIKDIKKDLVVDEGWETLKFIDSDIDRSNFKWLDESIPSFTLEQMREAVGVGYASGAMPSPQDYISEYFKQTYNIDLP